MSPIWICVIAYACVCAGFCGGYVACALLALDKRSIRANQVTGE